MSKPISSFERFARLQEIMKTVQSEMALLGDQLMAEGAFQKPSVLINGEGPCLKSSEAMELWKMIGGLKGADAIWSTYLSPSIFEGGRGFIRPNDNFKQYEEDIMRADPSRLLSWPSGFYRNTVTRETQFYVQIVLDDGEALFFCLDNLPTVNGEMRIVRRTNTGEFENFMWGAMAKEQFQRIQDELELTLNKITAKYFSE